MNKMRKIYKSTVGTGVLGVCVLLGATACSDDHFEIKQGTVTELNTLWENMHEHELADSLAMILSRTIVMKSKTDKSGKTSEGLYTYDQLLNSLQSFTVWAPVNGTYNARHYLNLLDQRDAAFADDPSSEEAWALNYAVANQFVLNHIARFNYEATREVQKVHLLNSKVATYEAAGSLFNSISMRAEQVNSANGTLHFLNGISPFAYNIYDYMATDESYSKLWEILSDPAIDKREFSETMSTPGAMNENGEVVYVDSVYRNTNEYLDRCGAFIQNEDSLYVALLPTDACWDEAYATVSKLFRYGDTYKHDWDKRLNGGTGGFQSTLRLDKDSLMAYNTNEALISSAFFTVSRFPLAAQKDSASINHYALYADSLISTDGLIYYNSNVGGENPMFNGQQPVKASNGYIYAVDAYRINPSYSWITKTILDMRYPSYVAAVSSSEMTSLSKNGTGEGQLITLYEGGRNEAVKGTLEHDNYRRFESDGSTMSVDFRLPGIFSGKYKISAIMVPNRTNIDLIQYDSDGEEVDERTTFTCQVRDDEGKLLANRVQRDAVVVDPDVIQAYVLFESVEFSKCYVGLPSGYDSFPTLRLSLSGNARQNGNSKSLNIEKIILEPVRE